MRPHPLLPRPRAAAAIAVLALGAAAPCWSAEAYPTKPVRFLVGFAPGGVNDLVARIVATRLSTRLGQQIIVENRPGAGGNIATQQVARATPDGYTMLLGSVSSLAMSPAILREVPFDPISDFASVTRLVDVSALLAVHPSLPARSVKELVALARKQPGKLTMASPGMSSIAHLAGELFMVTAGVKLLHVPYKGGGPAVVDAVAGQVETIISIVSTAAPHAKSGRLRGLGVSGARRVSILPDVPTIAEAGYPGFEASGWLGMLFPAKTPATVVERMFKETIAVLNEPAVRDQIEANGIDPSPSKSPEAFHAYMKSEFAKWDKVVKAAGIKPE
jgi:tripartite-type tricarboxylate transporter receptor subunit TctC